MLQLWLLAAGPWDVGCGLCAFGPKPLSSDLKSLELCPLARMGGRALKERFGKWLDIAGNDFQNSYPHCSHRLIPGSGKKQIPRSSPSISKSSCPRIRTRTQGGELILKIPHGSKKRNSLFSCRISIENAFYEEWSTQPRDRPPTPLQNPPFCRINHSTPQRAGSQCRASEVG